MPELPKKKVGIIACSGEEMAEGTVTRLAALKVLEQLRPADTVTICLPLFLAGGEGDRAFARFYPTIAIDGCDKRCAARATEMYSGKPAAGVVVTDLIAERGLEKPEGLHRLNEAGLQAVDVTAERVVPWSNRPADGLSASSLVGGHVCVCLSLCRRRPRADLEWRRGLLRPKWSNRRERGERSDQKVDTSAISACSAVSSAACR